ncbi:MAG: alpha/beta hydrolase [candidate division KSB1 bacterium]|nr:alpha/beta hydrolase [candidate division KSB1 bacterium]MDZ7368686.1 alpha/beta hydrolase [candidate division KSB1 bacterium]MDZ7406573.1 alpha/beta hydrolase [candidate division KSB1 bacterium]
MIQDRFLVRAATWICLTTALAHGLGLHAGEELTTPRLRNGTFKARVNNVEISYTVSGSGPAIFVQGGGWGPDSRLYRNTLKFLETSYTLVYIDPRGTGEAAPIADLAQLTSDLMADDLEALRQHLGLARIVVLGHAHGGFIAMKYALKYPSRLSQLILVACVLLPNLEEDTRAVNENLQRHPRRKDPGWETAMVKFKNEYEARTVEEIQENLRATAVLYFHYYSQSHRANFEKAITESKISLSNFQQFVRNDWLNYDLNGEESRLATPALLLYGVSDPYFIRASARRLHFTLRNSKLELFERSGHYPWIEEPQHFAEVVKAFLNHPVPAPVASKTPREAPQDQ